MTSSAVLHPADQDLQFYLAGSLSEAQSLRLEQHLQHCAACIERLDRLDQVGGDDALLMLARHAGQLESEQRASTAGSSGEASPEFENYELLRELGRGGMGVVYLARDRRLGRLVALKTMLHAFAHRAEARSRFQIEVEALASVHHPNIVQVFEVGWEAGGYVALEYVAGQDLQEVLNVGRMASREAAGLVLVLARALHAAHQRAILHRDLKPRNILLASDGTPKIADFGLAKFLDRDAEHTRIGAILGTPAYMAPEQAAGRPDVHAAVDIYALGAILYRCITGEVPFEGESTLTVLRRIVDEAPARPRDVAGDIPRDLETICLKCLEKSPAARYSSAAALADDLQRFLDERPIQARSVSAGEHVWRWSRRNPILATVIGLLIGSLLAGLTATTLLWRRAERSRRAVADARSELEGALDKANAANLRARRNLYATLVANSWSQYLLGNLSTAASLLDQCAADPEMAALRGWEWSYVNQLCHDELMRFESPENGIARQVAYSGDGRLLASAHGPLRWRDAPDAINRILIRDAESGELLQTVEAHLGRVNDLQFSPDSRFLASTGSDERLRVWNVEQVAPSVALPETFSLAGVDSNSPVCFSPDSQTLGYLADPTKIVLRDVAGRSEPIEHPTDEPILDFEFDPTSELLITVTAAKGGYRTDARLLVNRPGDPTVLQGWDLPDSKGNTTWQLARGPRLLAVGSSTGRLVLLDPSGKGQLTTISDTSGKYSSLAFSPDGRFVATAGPSGVVGILDVATSDWIPSPARHSLNVTDVSFSEDGSQLATSSSDGTVRVWDLTRPPLGQLIPIDWSAKDLAGHLEGDQLVVATRNSWVVTDVVTGDVKSTRQSPATTLPLWPRSDFALGGRGTWLAAPDRNDSSTIVVYHAGTRLPKLRLHGHRGRVLSLAWDATARRLASGATQEVGGANVSQIKLWDIATGQETKVTIPELAGIVWSLAFSPDGSRLAVGMADDGMVRIFDVATGRLLRELEGATSCFDLAFDPLDGMALAAADHNASRLLVWNCETGQPRFAPLEAPQLVSSVTFSPDGRRLAAVGRQSEVQLWDAVNGNALISLKSQGPSFGTRGWTPGVAFSTDGNRLCSIHGDSVNVWSIPNAEQPADLQRREEARRRRPFWHLRQARASERARNREAARFHLRYCPWEIEAGADYWREFATAHRTIGQKVEEQRALQRCLELSSDNPWSWYHFGKFHATRDHFEEGLRYLEKSHSLFLAPPDDLEPLLARCRAGKASQETSQP